MTSEARKINVRLIPKASRNAVIGWVTISDKEVLKCSVTAVPENGKANDALIKLLADYFGVAKSCISITKGATDRNKTVEIQGI